MTRNIPAAQARLIVCPCGSFTFEIIPVVAIYVDPLKTSEQSYQKGMLHRCVDCRKLIDPAKRCAEQGLPTNKPVPTPDLLAP